MGPQQGFRGQSPRWKPEDEVEMHSVCWQSVFMNIKRKINHVIYITLLDIV